MSNPLENIVFISLPEQIDRDLGSFQLDPAILLPVERPVGADDTWDFADLTWEMILSAILKVLAYQTENEHNDYYRQFALTIKPDIIEILVNSAYVKQDLKEFDMAEEIILSLIGLKPESAAFRLNLALLYESRAEHYKNISNDELSREYELNAKAAFREVLEMDNTAPEAWYFAGLYFVRRNDYQSAIELLESFVARAESEGDLEDEDTQARIERAENIVRECRNLNLSSRLYKEAFEDIEAGKEDEGIGKIREFLEGNAESWNAWFLLGWAFRRIRKFAEARDAFLKALNLGGGKNSELFNELAICELELGNSDQSESYLHKAMILDPNNVKVVSNLGILKLRAKEVQEAKNLFESVLVLEPEDPVARQYLDYIKGLDNTNSDNS